MSKKICSLPGCPILTKGARCESHTLDKEKANREFRGSASQRGYDSRWRKAKKVYLGENPLCVVEIGTEGEKVPEHLANTVDHIIPHRGDNRLFWEVTNWQSMCKTHHDEKTRRGE